MRSIHGFANRAEADLAAGLLQAHGIEAVVQADDAGGAYGPLSLGTGGASLQVADADHADAVELLDDTRAATAPADGPTGDAPRGPGGAARLAGLALLLVALWRLAQAAG